MSVERFLANTTFFFIALQGAIYISWIIGGLRYQKSYIVLLWLALVVFFDALVVVFGFALERGYMLYNLTYAREVLKVYFLPGVYVVTTDIVTMVLGRFGELRLKKLLDGSLYAVLGVLSAATLYFFWWYISLAEELHFELARLEGMLVYLPTINSLFLQSWEIAWSCAVLLETVYLQVWTSSALFQVSLMLFSLLQVAASLVTPGLAIVVVALSRSFCLFALLSLQQWHIRKALDDKKYQEHQALFNAILRRRPQPVNSSS